MLKQLTYLLICLSFSVPLSQTTLAKNAQTNTINPEPTRTLIVFYDPTQLSASQLTQKAEQLGTTLLSQYKNFNAIAVYVNQSYALEKTYSQLIKIKGIIQIIEDQSVSILQKNNSE